MTRKVRGIHGNNVHTIYKISSLEDWGTYPSMRWIIKNQASGVLCGKCTRILPCDSCPQSVVYHTTTAERHLHVSGSAAGIALVHESVATKMLQVLKNYKTAVPLDRTGAVLHDFVSLWTDTYTDPRITTWRYIDICSGCGIVRAYPGSNCESYFVSYQIQDRPAFLGRAGGMYVTKNVVAEFGLDKMKNIVLQPTAVIDAPIDGLRYPYDPEWVIGTSIHDFPKNSDHQS
jgi:hypothetical protein